MTLLSLIYDILEWDKHICTLQPTPDVCTNEKIPALEMS